MASHANDLDFLLNPGRPAETDADECKEDELRDGDGGADGADASPSNKIALAFILDTPQEELEEKYEAFEPPCRQSENRPDLLSIDTSIARRQREDEDKHSDDQDADGDESEEKEDAADATPRPLATSRTRSAASRASRAARASPPSPTTGGTPTNRKGSKYCAVEGCTSRAKHSRRCWKHGGSVKCKVPDCPNRAKTKGVCWSHGGGTICSVAHCTTIAVSNGVCWAHGGGKRCVVPRCNRPAYERTGNMCTVHFEATQARGGASQGGGAEAAS